MTTSEYENSMNTYVAIERGKSRTFLSHFRQKKGVSD